MIQVEGMSPLELVPGDGVQFWAQKVTEGYMHHFNWVSLTLFQHSAVWYRQALSHIFEDRAGPVSKGGGYSSQEQENSSENLRRELHTGNEFNRLLKPRELPSHLRIILSHVVPQFRTPRAGRICSAFLTFSNRPSVNRAPYD
ncbi:hypothetical protein V5799_028145 [Amblyomma americanum]|uniref:Uncharacterized protein n=1 Tax=Amblyomma americanum TaxID=6943 RepID=A0AAQ4DDP3_AMBAM